MSLIPLLMMSTLVHAAGVSADRGGHISNHYRPNVYEKNRHGQNHHRHHHRYYPYRPYYPWGLGLGLSLATGWGWINGFYNNGWYGNGWNNGGSVYWNGPYSGIGISLPLRANESEVYRSAPTQVTTSMQYASQELGAQETERMVSSQVMPTTLGANGQPDGRSAINHEISLPRGRSVSSLPANAKLVQHEGRTLYEWQGVLYAFDWDSQSYQEQLVK
ncbi:hypothetical protein [Shewanella acanthi]|uniref:hypothetical protein n=1 Tax=Shewanella acanthi TaxID=2864212 RepID=UPI001C654DED|nr:hypothetical protein [Shewanella acanthi]QYJ79223.1 hypothetical protein K0H61_01880 [Shewanella acanthi]